MRRNDFNGSAKTVAASTTVTFTPSDIPSEQVVAYHLLSWATDGAGNAFDTIDRIRVKANGVTRWDVTGGMFANLVEKTFWSNPLYASTFQCLTIPFFNVLNHDEDIADQCQFEPGANASIEIVYGSGAEAGSVFCGWTQTNIAPRFYTKYYGQQMNIANGAVNGRFNLSEGGGIMGFGIPMLGLSRMRLVLNGTQWINLPGMDYVAAASQGLIGEAQRYATALVPTGTVPLNHFHLMTTKPENGIPAAPGQSFVEIDTNGASAWAGVANEFSIYSAVPIG